MPPSLAQAGVLHRVGVALGRQQRPARGVHNTVAAGAASQQARKWWAGEIAFIAKSRNTEPGLLMTPPTWPSRLLSSSRAP